MPINKIIKSPTPIELVNKVNEMVGAANALEETINGANGIDAKTLGGKFANNTNNNLVVWGIDGKLNFPNGTQFWIG